MLKPVCEESKTWTKAVIPVALLISLSSGLCSFVFVMKFRFVCA